mgnify:FL=1
MRITPLGFASKAGSENARETGEGRSFSLSVFSRGLKCGAHNLSKEGSTNE